MINVSISKAVKGKQKLNLSGHGDNIISKHNFCTSAKVNIQEKISVQNMRFTKSHNA